MRLDKQHIFVAWTIIIAIGVGLVFGGSQLLLPRLLGLTYSPLAINSQASPLVMDETIAYASKAQEVLNGHWRLSDLFIWEYKQSPSPLVGESFPAVIMALMAKLT